MAELGASGTAESNNRSTKTSTERSRPIRTSDLRTPGDASDGRVPGNSVTISRVLANAGTAPRRRPGRPGSGSEPDHRRNSLEGSAPASRPSPPVDPPHRFLSPFPQPRERVWTVRKSRSPPTPPMTFRMSPTAPRNRTTRPPRRSRPDRTAVLEVLAPPFADPGVPLTS